MKIAVYNQHWATAGGGERFAGGIAEALARRPGRQVSLVAHSAVDTDGLSERLQLDLSGVTVEVVGPAPEAVTAASGRADVFVNASYASDIPSAAPRSMYVVHFPVTSTDEPSRARRLLADAGRRLDPGGGGVVVRDGLHPREWVGRLPVRWTTGEAVLEVPGENPVTVLLGRLQPAVAGEVQVEALVGGRVVARAEVAPRSSRVDPWVTRLTVPPIGAGRHELRLRSRSWSPAELDGSSSDDRRLGVAVVAIEAGARAARARGLAGQLSALPDRGRGFLDTYPLVVANSAFTRDWIGRLWGRDAAILHPPVRPQPRVAKEPIVLGVGRFFDPADGHNKRQLELVSAFARLQADDSPHRDAARGWELHLVGGYGARGEDYVERVRAAAEGLPVRLHLNASGAEVRDLYSRAALFWHATGLGEDPEAHPERLEHFGISTVEAMSAGAVPVVIGVAGQLELFDDGVAGYHWQTVEELVARTGELMADPVERAFMADRAVEAAGRFGPEPFAAHLEELVATL